jgi:FHS family L-fucose permease-like MFS transporter
MTKATSKYSAAFAAVTSLFFMWGLITVLVDALIPRLKEVFELSYQQASLVQVAWFMAYGIVSIPAGVLLSRIGYKTGVIVGLVLASIGCALFYPAAEFRVFGFFLTALFVLASGITVLQVAANPYIAVLGSPDKAASRLNLSQAFNSLGTTIAPMLAATYLLSDKILSKTELEALDATNREQYFVAEASAVEGPFLIFAAVFLALALSIAMVKLPRILGDNRLSWGSVRKVLTHQRLLFGALGIFVYVGAEVAIGSFLTNYFLDLELQTLILEHPTLRSVVSGVADLFSAKALDELDAKGIVGTFVVFYWGGAMVGRFVGSALTRFVNPATVLAVFGLGAIALITTSVLSTGLTAMFAILLVGFCNSVMFPTIFTMSIDGLGDLKPEASGILCTAIVGGAFIPNLVGTIRDTSGSFGTAFLIPMVCYLIIITFALRYRKVIA